MLKPRMQTVRKLASDTISISESLNNSLSVHPIEEEFPLSCEKIKNKFNNKKMIKDENSTAYNNLKKSASISHNESSKKLFKYQNKMSINNKEENKNTNIVSKGKGKKDKCDKGLKSGSPVHNLQAYKMQYGLSSKQRIDTNSSTHNPSNRSESEESMTKNSLNKKIIFDVKKATYKELSSLNKANNIKNSDKCSYSNRKTIIYRSPNIKKIGVINLNFKPKNAEVF